MRLRSIRSRGFTLVEIVITLSLVALLMALALGSTITLTHTRALHVPMGKVQEFAKKARSLAIVEQRPYQVELMPNSVAIYSLVSQAPAGGSFGAADGAKPRGRVDYYEWDSDVSLSVRRWNAKEFLPPQRQVWTFEHSGLCEPLTVRVDSEYGFVEMTFNPLDAHAEADSKASSIK